MKKDFKGIETQLFNWKKWDECGEGDYIFYDVTIKSTMGDYPMGAKFAFVNFLLSQSTMELFENENDKEPKVTCDLVLSMKNVKNRI